MWLMQRYHYSSVMSGCQTVCLRPVDDELSKTPLVIEEEAGLNSCEICVKNLQGELMKDSLTRHTRED